MKDLLPNKIFWRFVPPQILITLVVLIGFVVFFSDRIAEIFLTNVGLNSIIIFTILYTCFTVLCNCIKLLRSAEYIDVINEHETISPSKDNIISITQYFTKHRLTGMRKLLKSSYFSDAIKEFCTTGYFNLSSEQTHNIKTITDSKLSRDRQVVQYFIGILVMLGLIGTFWGLLETIKSVGEAMNSIVDSIGGPQEGGDENDNQLGSFIGSIAKPLEGMGLAFSSSLFGLTGSLLAGFLNFFAVNAQSKFTEDFYNWLENRTEKSIASTGGTFAQGGAFSAQSAPMSGTNIVEISKGVLSHMDKVMECVKVLVESQASQQESLLRLNLSIDNQNVIISNMVGEHQLAREAAMQQSSHLISIEVMQKKFLEEITMIRQGVHSRFQETIQQRLLDTFKHTADQLHETMVSIHQSHLAGIDSVKHMLEKQDEFNGHMIGCKQDSESLLLSLNEINNTNKKIADSQYHLSQQLVDQKQVHAITAAAQNMNAIYKEGQQVIQRILKEYEDNSNPVEAMDDSLNYENFSDHYPAVPPQPPETDDTR